MLKFVLGLITIITLFFGIRYLIEGFVDKSNYISIFNQTTIPQQILPQQNVSSGGPSTPNAAPRENMATMLSQPEQPTDPYDQPESEFPLEDNLRHPERSFGPGPANEETNISTFSGIASTIQPSNSTFGSFSPEFAQNGGYVDHTILANDTLDEHNYSVF